jgi:hypothetical protein
MKSKFLICFSVACLCSLIYLSSCGGKGDDPSPVDEMRTLLTSGTWNLQTVLVGGVDQTAVYTGLTLRFTDTNFTATNGRVIWPASGTWQFSDETGKIIQRNDGLLVTIETATTNSLVLKLDWDETTLGSGRVASVEGAHTFNFTK